MNTTISSNLSDAPIYRKAIYINWLSRNISMYLHCDLASLRPDGKEDHTIYFSGDIVQQSTHLAPEIINAEKQRNSDKKYQHFAQLDKLISRLYNNCQRLEKSDSNGRDYLLILRSELKKFRQLQRSWMLTL